MVKQRTQRKLFWLVGWGCVVDGVFFSEPRVAILFCGRFVRYGCLVSRAGRFFLAGVCLFAGTETMQYVVFFSSWFWLSVLSARKVFVSSQGRVGVVLVRDVSRTPSLSAACPSKFERGEGVVKVFVGVGFCVSDGCLVGRGRGGGGVMRDDAHLSSRQESYDADSATKHTHVESYCCVLFIFVIEQIVRTHENHPRRASPSLLPLLFFVASCEDASGLERDNNPGILHVSDTARSVPKQM